MCKDTKKNNRYNQIVIKELAKRYSVSKSMVIKSLLKTRTSKKAKEILNEYNRISPLLDNITETIINKL